MNYFYILILLAVSCFVKAQQPYYNDVDLSVSGEALYLELQIKIDQASSTFTYGDARDIASDTDEDTQNNNNVLLVYGYNDTDGNCTTDRSRDKDDFGGMGCEWNREHVFARGNANPSMGDVTNTTTGIGADPHNIRPSDQQMNNNKGNKKLGAGSGNAGNVGSGNWYPGDEWKGDVARMMMYMYVRYGDRCLPSLMGTGPLEGSTQMLQLFLQWNAEDPVSTFEDQRNPILENNYGNRNPFIDNPYLATRIWGGPEAEDRWNLFSVEDQVKNSLTIYPNPVATSFHLETAGTQAIMNLEMYSVDGKQVGSLEINNSNQAVDVSHLQKGLYLLVITSEAGSTTKKLVKR